VLAASDCAKSLLPDLGRSTSAKTATLLAEHMLEQLSTSQPEGAASRSYLFIRGDKSANNLQPILRDAGHTVYETQVYSTSLNPEFAGLVKSEIASLAASDAPGGVIWLAFFSPSSAGYALPYLTPLLDSAAVGETGPRVRVAAIGETSRAFLAESGITVHAVADEPNARGLVGAITSAS
jgi:uroporphyrinogen-III synthase